MNQLIQFYKKLTATTGRKIAFWTIVPLGTFIAVLVLAVSIFQKDIINAFVQEANKHLVAEVVPKDISVTVWKDFPNVSIAFDRVLVKEAVADKAKADTLAYFQTLYFTFNLSELIDGRYKLLQLYAENGKVTLEVDEKGKENFQIFKEVEDASNDKSFNFRLNVARLKNIDFAFRHLKEKDVYAIAIDDWKLKLDFRENLLSSQLIGECLLQELTIGGNTFVQGKEVSIQSPFSYHLETGAVMIEHARLELEEALFNLEGVYEPENGKHLFLQLDAEKANLQTLLAFVPSAWRSELEKYKTKGQSYFSATLDGKLADRKSPKIAVDFGFANASFYHPDFQKEITGLHMNGSFSNGKRQTMKTSVLVIDSIRGNLEGNPFSGRFKVSNFTYPYLNLKAKATVDIEDLLGIFPIDFLETGVGKLMANISYQGSIRNPSNEKATGWLSLEDGEFRLKDTPAPVRIPKLYTTFNRNKILIDTLEVMLNDSDLKATGEMRNWANSLADGAAQVSLKLESEVLKVGDLLSLKAKGASGKGGGVGKLPSIRANLAVKQFYYDNIHLDDVKGNIAIEGAEQYDFEQLSFDWLEGNFLLNGHFDNGSQREFQGAIGLQRVNVRDFFETFDDFGLEAISYKNLEGHASADLATKLAFDQQWNIDWKRSEVMIEGEVLEGKLLNYEPMQQVAFLLKNKDLENISFSKLSNSLHLKADTLFIPTMEVSSSAGKLFVSGKQRISGEMEYRLQIPLSNFKRPDKDEAYGAIEDDGLGHGNLFLLISGTPEDFKVRFDKDAVGKKIKNDLKKEKKEFKDLFKKKTKKEKQQGLSDEEF